MRKSLLVLSLCVFLLAVTACGLAPIGGSDPLPAEPPTAAASFAGEDATVVPSPGPSETMPPAPADTPTAAPSETPYLTPPAAGQAARIPILMYHHIESLGPDASATLRTWTVSPVDFRAQLNYIKDHGYHPITFAQLVAFFQEGKPLPTRPIILTFDDGWMDDYTVAFPALVERGMVGAFFVPTVYADAGGKSLLGWNQIKEMDAAGMEFGGHTLNHANLKQVGEAEALRQMQVSKQRMEQKLGHPTLAFSYPFGAYDARVVGLVRQVGYRAAVGLCCGYQIRADQMLTLPRIRISYGETLADMIKKLPPPDAAQTLLPASLE